MNDYIINTKLEGEAEHDKSQEKLVKVMKEANYIRKTWDRQLFSITKKYLQVVNILTLN